MKPLAAIALILRLAPLALVAPAEATERRAPVSEPSPEADLAAFEVLKPFLGTPFALPMRQLWASRGGTSIVTAQEGTVLAVQGLGGNKVRRSTDGGLTWGQDIQSWLLDGRGLADLLGSGPEP